ncbi:hypothetical protein NEISICOT_01618 [Neisseria sicca ATCC 29256]|uniref:Uncharacterized protein n=1 Tax=Neisseria sicca ATCC 29256 TaxID=547045 RepID=C6M518_NEISI|nr:hypothetical protein NEISICOT_01618 [Neisseria sicca ATCC 29256]
MHQAEQLFLHAEQNQSSAAAHHGVAGHQLRMGEAFVYVFIDDIGFIEDQITFNQNGDLVIRIHYGKIFGLIENINVFDFKIHAFFVQDEATALAERACNA